jgi:uncharacterized membrane protein
MFIYYDRMLMLWNVDIARELNTLGTGILAGALLMSTLGLRPAAAMLEAAQQVFLRQQLIQRLSKLMPPFMLLPIAASSVILVFHGTSGDWPIAAAGWAFSVSTVGITVIVNVPLNRRFARWSSSEFPEDWQIYVRRWDRANSIRFILALAAFACAVISGR